MSNLKSYGLPLAVILAAILMGLAAVKVKAGGWATISLDRLPEPVPANQPLEIGFVVRQHGVRPMAGLVPVVTATHPESGIAVQVEALPTGQEGHYATTVILSRPGRWQWSIQAFTMEVSFPDLEVVAESRRAVTPIQSLALGIGGLVGLAGSALVWWRQRVWGFTLITVAAGLVGSLSFIPDSNAGRPPALIKENRPAAKATLGQHLFIAKGCMTCHRHGGIQTGNDSLGIGPDLTRFTASPAYLRLWLKAPQAVKPKTLMPNLGLSEPEIEALTALFAGVAP